MRFARIAMGLLVAAVPVALSGAPVAHADTRLNQTCVGHVNIQFGVNGVYGNTVLGPGPFDQLQYDRGYFFNCQDVVLVDPPLGIGTPTEAHSNRVFGNLNGGCVAAFLSGNGDFHNGEGVLIGGTVLVAQAALGQTSPDLAFAEVDVMLPNGVPCTGETAATDLEAVNDLVN